MSLENDKENILEIEDKNKIKENNSIINRSFLNPIKINKSVDLKYSNNKTLDINRKNPLLLKQNEILLKNNGFFNYLNNIKIKKDPIYKIKNLSLKTRNNNNIILNDESKSSNSPKRINISEYMSPKNNNNKNYINNPNYIKLNSLFSLPPLIKKASPSKKNYFITEINSNKQRFNSIDNNKRILSNKINGRYLGNNSFNSKDREDNEANVDHRYDNINSFMKFKYYEDVNEKFEKKLRDDSFIDRGVKDKIIKIGKVGIFWRNVIEYCGSFIFAEKFKNIKKQFRKKYLIEEGNEFNVNKCSKTPNKRLYTNLLVNKIIHYQNKNKINE